MRVKGVYQVEKEICRDWPKFPVWRMFGLTFLLKKYFIIYPNLGKVILSLYVGELHSGWDLLGEQLVNDLTKICKK